MSTEAVPQDTENDLGMYEIVYRTASQATVTERHRKRVTEWQHERQLRQLPRDDHWDFAATKITVEGLQIGIE